MWVCMFSTWNEDNDSTTMTWTGLWLDLDSRRYVQGRRVAGPPRLSHSQSITHLASADDKRRMIYRPSAKHLNCRRAFRRAIFWRHPHLPLPADGEGGRPTVAAVWWSDVDNCDVESDLFAWHRLWPGEICVRRLTHSHARANRYIRSFYGLRFAIVANSSTTLPVFGLQNCRSGIAAL